MKGIDCITFLQWALPRLQMRWDGFIKVRRQVCKRIERRIGDLELDGIENYQRYLQQHAEEWTQLGSLCRITISRFYRDQAVFDYLRDEVLPLLARQVIRRGDCCLHVWSIGSCSGEEPYTVTVIWQLRLQSNYPEVSLDVLATDTDQHMIERARQACYPYSSTKELPVEWRAAVFDQCGDRYCLKPQYKHQVRFEQQDIVAKTPRDRFDLVLCRNLVFTYFNAALQRRTLATIKEHILPGGVLVVGIREKLPDKAEGFSSMSDRLRVYLRQ